MLLLGSTTPTTRDGARDGARHGAPARARPAPALPPPRPRPDVTPTSPRSGTEEHAVLRPGELCYYTRRDGSVTPVKVLQAHHDDTPPYYTISLTIDGSERQTVRSSLTTEAQRAKLPSPTPPPLLPGGAANATHSMAPQRRDDYEQIIRKAGSRHCVKGDGFCSDYAIMGGLGVLDHQREEAVPGTVSEGAPTPNDRRLVMALRERVVAKTGQVRYRPPDKYSEGQSYANDTSFYGDAASIAAAAAALKVDILSVDESQPSRTADLPLYKSKHTQQTGTIVEGAACKISVSDALKRLQKPSDTPLVVILFNGKSGPGGHYAVAVNQETIRQWQRKQPAWVSQVLLFRFQHADGAAAGRTDWLDDVDPPTPPRGAPQAHAPPSPHAPPPMHAHSPAHPAPSAACSCGTRCSFPLTESDGLSPPV